MPICRCHPHCYADPMWDQIIVVVFIMLGAAAVLAVLRWRRHA